MSIYTALALKGNQRATADFETRGLDLARCGAARAHIFGIPDAEQQVYKLYTRNIPAFIKANVENKEIPTNRYGYPFKLPVDRLIPIPFPPLVFTFPKALKPDEEGRILIAGGESFAVGKDKYYKLSRYSYDGVRELQGMGADSASRAVRGTTNIRGFIAFLTCLKIASGFLLTHNYPAFSTSEEGFGGDAWMIREGFAGGKRKSGWMHPSVKRMRKDADGEDTEMGGDDDEEADTLGVEALEFNSAECAGTMPVARPKYDGRKLWGTAGDLPPTDGIPFPYFHGLLDEDYTYVPSVIRQYFFSSLGGSKDESAAAFKDLKGGHGQWAMTESGLALQHLFIGIEIAIQSQARCFPILAPRYYGFGLCGARYSIYAQDKLHSPLKVADFLAEARKMSIHDISLADLMKKLSLLKRDKSYKSKEKAITKPSEITGARQLHEEVMKREVPEEERVEIQKLVAQLSFPQRYLTVSVENILEIFRLIASESTPDVTAPMYLGDGVITSTDSVLRCLSAFGPIAPSFRCAQGKKWKIPEKGEKDSASEIPEGKKVPSLSVIVVAKKDLFQSADDWKAVRRDRAIYVRDERASAFRAARFGGDDRATLWKGLKDLFAEIPEEVGDAPLRFDAEKVVLGGFGLKRKADDLDDF